MTRLLATIRCDLRVQFRNGFYYASAFVALIWLLFLLQLPADYRLWLLPVFLFGEVLMNSFFFIAGLVLLEKGEGSLEAQIVTPLRTWEYLAAKIITLGLLTVTETAILTAGVYRLHWGMLPMLCGVLGFAALCTLYGFIAVARYNSINEYLLPSIVYTIPLILPFVSYFGVWPSGLWYLHPAQGPFVLMLAAVQPISAWQMLYGVLYSGFWIGVTYWFTRRAFHRFVITKA